MALPRNPSNTHLITKSPRTAAVTKDNYSLDPNSELKARDLATDADAELEDFLPADASLSSLSEPPTAAS